MPRPRYYLLDSHDEHESRSRSFYSIASMDSDDGILRVRTDIEAQPLLDEEAGSRSPPLVPVEAEYRVSTSKKLAALSAYFALNLGLTLYNKAVLGSFKFPWLLTAIHSASASLGCYGLLCYGTFRLTRLSTRENLILAAFSTLFTINIAMSNISLAMVSIPFHQIMRSTTPVFTILIYRVWFSRTYATLTYLSLIPLIAGVGLATYGDYYFTTLGFVLTLLGVVLAAVKTVVTNRLMTGSLKLPALEVLLRMSPLAAMQSLLYAYLTGELASFNKYVEAGSLTKPIVFALLGNGMIAFLLNISSFQTNKLAGALTITVCGNVKQCLTIVMGIALFQVHVGLLNGVGMAIALCGAAWYSKVELAAKKGRSKPVEILQDSKHEHEKNDDNNTIVSSTPKDVPAPAKTG